MGVSCMNTINGAILPPSICSQTHLNFKNRNISKTPFNSLSFKSNLSCSTSFLLPKFKINRLKIKRNFSLPIIFAVQSNIFRAIQTVLKVGRDGIEAGTNLVPDAVPRPIARLSVGVVAVTISLFVIRSFISTVLFSLGVMGFVYFVYIALNKDKESNIGKSSSSTSTDDALEEAKKIMDKYK